MILVIILAMALAVLFGFDPLRVLIAGSISVSMVSYFWTRKIIIITGLLTVLSGAFVYYGFLSTMPDGGHFEMFKKIMWCVLLVNSFVSMMASAYIGVLGAGLTGLSYRKSTSKREN
jgi:hypothetical protein